MLDKTIVPAIIFARIAKAKSTKDELFSYSDADVLDALTDFRTDQVLNTTVSEKNITLESFVYGCISRGLLSIYNPCMHSGTATLESFKLAAYSCLSKPVGLFLNKKNIKKRANASFLFPPADALSKHTGWGSGIQPLYFRDGDYFVEILDACVKENRHGLKIAIIECRVKNCNNPKISIGRSLSWVCKLQGSQIGPIDLKNQLAGILNCHPNQITPQMVEKYLTPDTKTGLSPLAGTNCYVHAKTVTTQKGDQFVKVDFIGATETQTKAFEPPKQDIYFDKQGTVYESGHISHSVFENVVTELSRGSIRQKGRMKISQPYSDTKSFELLNKSILSSVFLKKMIFVNKNRNVDKLVGVSLLEPLTGGCVISIKASNINNIRPCQNVESLEKEGDYFFDSLSGFCLFYSEGGLGEKLPNIFEGSLIYLGCPKLQIPEDVIACMHFIGIPKVGSEVFFDENFHFTSDARNAKFGKAGYVVGTEYLELSNVIEVIFDI